MTELSRAVVVGEVSGPLGLRAVDDLGGALGGRYRVDAVPAHLHEPAVDPDEAIGLYLRGPANTRSIAERDHLTKRAARLRAR
jgi:predicted RNA polymerase sigma factor